MTSPRSTFNFIYFSISLSLFPFAIPLRYSPSLLLLRLLISHHCPSMKAEMRLLRYLPRLGRTRLSLSRYLIIIFIILPTIFYIFVAYLVPTSPALIPASLLLSKRPMLIVAHPDDESLFFGPTILRLTQTKHKALAGEQKDLRILVLSSGISINSLRTCSNA